MHVLWHMLAVRGIPSQTAVLFPKGTCCGRCDLSDHEDGDALGYNEVTTLQAVASQSPQFSL